MWRDNKGRLIDITTMSDRWLNNIRKSVKDKSKKQAVLDELKRRKLKHKNK